jgi:TetR/AcrR family transcriptional repressor of mexJK operon
MHTDTHDTTDRRQQILEAALRVFSTKGFQKATNKDIADAAGGISPGLIYHYFKDKEDLFMSLIRERGPIFQLAEHPERLIGLPPREALTMVGQTYLGMMSNPINAGLFRLLMGEVLRFPQLGDMVYRFGISRIFNLMTTYLQRQIDQGVLRPHYTGIGARSFIGMLVIHIMAREILHQPEAIAASNETVVANAVDIFLNGLKAEE